MSLYHSFSCTLDYLMYLYAVTDYLKVARKVSPREVNSEWSKSNKEFDSQSQETSGFYGCLSLSQVFLL